MNFYLQEINLFPEIHLKQHGFIHNACGQFTKRFTKIFLTNLVFNMVWFLVNIKIKLKVHNQIKC